MMGTQSLSTRRGDRTSPKRKPRVSLVKLLVGCSFILLCGMQWIYRRVLYASASFDHQQHGSASASSVNVQKDIQQHPEATSNQQQQQPVVDILSIGSNLQQPLQQAQRSTMGRHPAVRHFVGVNETIDTERDCHSRLTMNHIRSIVHHCTQLQPLHKDQYPIWTKIRASYARLKWLQKKTNPMGWMCAQKRPIDAFFYYIQPFLKHIQPQQQQPSLSDEQQSLTRRILQLPDYLMVMDDDTWMALDYVVPYLQDTYPPDGPPRVIAGCMIRSNVHEHNFTIPFGGYGLIFNRAALQRWIQPIHCQQYGTLFHSNQTDPPSNTHDSFEQLACWRIAQSPIGEGPLFREGMSIAQLMQSYVVDQPYLQVDQWNRIGFCMHSDWVWGYFVNYYHIAIHTTHEPYYANVLQDRLVGYNYSQIYAGSKIHKTIKFRRQCNHKTDEKCRADAHVCHRISIAHMNELFLAQTSRMRRQVVGA